MADDGRFVEGVAPLPASVRAPGEARNFLAAELAAAGVLLESAHVDAALLVTSELVTNAVVHARPPLELHVVIDGGSSVRVAVVDGEPTRPEPGRSPGAIGGWGMGVVERMSTAWGVGPRPDGAAGKVVWAELPLG